MKEQKEWIPYQKIDWEDIENNKFNIDTRDFYAGYHFTDEKPNGWYKIKKYIDRFFFTKEDLVSLLDRYFEESGGKAEWRMFTLKGFENWKLKYLRILRTELGFVICDSDNNPVKKEVLNQDVIKKYLCTH